MRILIVTEVFLPAVDGMVLRLTEAIRYLHKEGHDVAVVTLNRGIDQFEGAMIYGIADARLPFGKKLLWAPSFKKIYDIMLDFSPQVVHIANPFVMGVAAAEQALRLGVPYIVSYHTNFKNCLNRFHINTQMTEKLLWRSRKKISDGAVLNLCTSHVMRYSLRDHGIHDVHVLKRGVDSERRHPKYASEDMRMILSKGQNDKKLLVYIGSLTAAKDLESLLPMMKRRDDVCLAIVGDGDYRQQLERAFSGTNTVFTGYLRGKNLAEAYASGDAYIFPTRHEQVGVGLLEVMASGIPIIAVRAPLTTEQFQDGRDVLLYTAGDEESLDAAIDCIDDVELMRRMGKIVRQEAEASSWERASQQLMDYYSIAYTRATHYN